MRRNDEEDEREMIFLPMNVVCISIILTVQMRIAGKGVRCSLLVY